MRHIVCPGTIDIEYVMFTSEDMDEVVVRYQRDTFKQDRAKTVTNGLLRVGFIKRVHGHKQNIREEEAGNATKRKQQQFVSVPMWSFPSKYTVCEQKDVKSRLPPGQCWIWKSRRARTWRGICSINGIMSASCSKYGEKESPLVVFRSLWRQHIGFHGLGLDTCTVAGLFDENAVSSV